MPLHDYRCPRCGWILQDQYRNIVQGAQTAPPCCTQCPGMVYMQWIPQAAFDMKGDGEGDKGFQKFTVHRQVPTAGGMVQREEVVDSLHKLRQIEKDSEQRYRNGEGEPMRFRGYAQNRSNMDQGSFGTSGTIGGRTYDSGSAPAKSGKVSVKKHGAERPKVTVAKGMGQSALKDRK